MRGGAVNKFWGFGRFSPTAFRRPHLSQLAESCGRKPPKTSKKALDNYYIDFAGANHLYQIQAGFPGFALGGDH